MSLIVEDRYLVRNEKHLDLFKSARVDVSNGAMILFGTRMYKLSKLLERLYVVYIDTGDTVEEVTIAIDPNKLCSTQAAIFFAGIDIYKSEAWEHILDLIESNLTVDGLAVSFHKATEQEDE